MEAFEVPVAVSSHSEKSKLQQTVRNAANNIYYFKSNASPISPYNKWPLVAIIK